jgi:hypothetical protein
LSSNLDTTRHGKNGKEGNEEKEEIFPSDYCAVLMNARHHPFLTPT